MIKRIRYIIKIAFDTIVVFINYFVNSFIVR